MRSRFPSRSPTTVLIWASARRIPTSEDTPGGSGAARGLLPDGHVLAALARERLVLPAAPAVAQVHVRELRHQVELGRPHVPEQDREALDAAVDEVEVVRDQPLVGDVVLVEAPVGLADVEGADG